MNDKSVSVSTLELYQVSQINGLIYGTNLLFSIQSNV